MNERKDLKQEIADLIDDLNDNKHPTTRSVFEACKNYTWKQVAKLGRDKVAALEAQGIDPGQLGKDLIGSMNYTDEECEFIWDSVRRTL